MMRVPTTRLDRLESRLADELNQAAMDFAFRVNAILTLEERASLADHIRRYGFDRLAVGRRSDSPIRAILDKIHGDPEVERQMNKIPSFIGHHSKRKKIQKEVDAAKARY